MRSVVVAIAYGAVIVTGSSISSHFVATDRFNACQQPTTTAFDDITKTESEASPTTICVAYDEVTTLPKKAENQQVDEESEDPTSQVPAVKPVATEVTEVEFYFIRHAESEWNEVKNAGFFQMPLKKIHKGLNYLMHKVGMKELRYRDAVLSKQGIQQSEVLAKFIAGYDGEAIKDILGKTTVDEEAKAQLKFLREFTTAKDLSVAVATSNLRRAAMTLLIAFHGRILSKGINEVFVLSALQERSKEVDASSLAAAGHRPVLTPAKTHTGDSFPPKYEGLCPFKKKTLVDLFKPECNTGDHIEDPLAKFCNWMHFQAKNKNKTKFVIVGHSSWLFDFYVDYLQNVVTPKVPKQGLREGASKAFTSLWSKSPKDSVYKIKPDAADFTGDKDNNDADNSKINAVEEALMKKVSYKFGLETKKQKLGNAGVIYTKIKLPASGGCAIIPGSTIKLTPYVDIKVSGE